MPRSDWTITLPPKWLIRSIYALFTMEWLHKTNAVVDTWYDRSPDTDAIPGLCV